MEDEIMTTEAQEPVSTVETALQTDDTPAATAPQTTEPDVISIPRAEYERQIQDRVKNLVPYKQLVSRFEKLGYSREDLERQLNEFETKQQQETYQRAGIQDPDALRQAILQVPEVAQMFQAQREQAERSQWAELANAHPWVTQEHVNTPEFASLMERGYSPLHAFRAIYADVIAQQALHSGEQAALANVTGRNNRQVAAGDAPGASTKLNPATMTDDEVMAIAERVKRGEHFSFR